MMKKIVTILICIVLLHSCALDEFKRTTDAKFADQSFKTAIANIELYKIRFGEYPEELSDLKFLGEWDGMMFRFLEYRRIDNGYELDMVEAYDLDYPPEFWKGLGLKSSNVKK